ncbi:D-inositol-3-phosphate glycosyltransferase [subsurface metagenome]
MKIGIVIGIGFKELHGGNIRCFYLVKELIRRKHEITIFQGIKKDAKDFSRRFGCNCVGVGRSTSRWQSNFRKMLNSLSFILKTKKNLKNFDFDVLFGINVVHSIPIVWQKGAKSVLLYVDMFSDLFESEQRYHFLGYPVSRIIRWIENWTIRKADRVMMITETMKDMIRKPFSQKIMVIPDGADTQIFSPGVNPNDVKRKYGIDNEPIIGYQGGISRHEGLQFLAMAAPFVLKEIPEARFLISGKGEYLSEIKKIIEKNKTQDHFIFTGWLDYYRIPEILAATTVSVIPMPDIPFSRAIISFKLLEGLASGTPLVVNDLPGVREIVDETMVTFTKVESPQRFARDIIKVLRMDKEKIESMTTKGHHRVEKLDWRKIAMLDADLIEGKDVSEKAKYLFA